jgi:flagellar motor switch protein FliM
MTAAAAQEGAQRDAFAAIFGGEPSIVERLPMLPVALERAADACCENLRGVAALAPKLHVLGIARGAVSQLLDEEEGLSVLELLYAPEWSSHILVRVERELAFAYIDMVMGGDGQQPPFTQDRPLTRIEAEVGRTLIARLGKALETGFSALAQTAFVSVEGEKRLDFDLMGGVNAPIAIVRLRVEFGDRGGDVLLGIPRNVLTALRPALARSPSDDMGQADPGWSRQMQSEITRTKLILRAILEERLQPLGDIADLKVGQILELEATPRSRIRVECNGEPLLWCEIGKSNGSYTLRVDGFIDHDQEFMHGILSG